jgi:TetR/AcrR family transcriptional repressor of nem operon
VFRARLDQVFRAWERRLVDCLDEARSAGEIDATLDSHGQASFIMAGWEGAILRAKTVKSLQPMECFEEVLFSRVLSPKHSLTT